MPRSLWDDLPPIIRHARVSRKKRQLARRLRRQATASEKLAWELLRGRRLLGLKFRRQQVIRGYVVDFYCAELRVALEIDGACHGDPGQAEYDLNRTVELWEMGVITLRMWAEDVIRVPRLVQRPRPAGVRVVVPSQVLDLLKPRA
jgi:very-short-patch-repair endonuclease